MTARLPPVSGALAVFICLNVAIPSRASAQAAWVPFQGEGSLSFVFQALDYDGHFDAAGTRLVDTAASQAYVGIVQFEYGWTNRLAFTARLPYIASRFTGTDHEPIMVLIHDRYEELRRTHPELAALSSLDTGNYYATFQDFGFTLRYNILDRGLTVTPVVGLTIPSHHYKTIGEAAPGQDRLALHTGVNAGRLLDPLLPNAYLHARYTYSFVQPLHDIPLDRSSAEFEVGYAVTPTVSIRAIGNWMFTHGGMGFWEAYENPLVFLSHDRLLSAHYWQAGGGATIALSDSFDLEGAVLTVVHGADTHYGLGVNVGLTWRFLTPRARPSPVTKPPGAVTAPGFPSIAIRR